MRKKWRKSPLINKMDAELLEAYVHKNAMSRTDAARLKRQLRKLVRV